MRKEAHSTTGSSDSSGRPVASPIADLFWTLVSLYGAFLGVGMVITAKRVSLLGHTFALGLLACSVTLFYLTLT